MGANQWDQEHWDSPTREVILDMHLGELDMSHTCGPVKRAATPSFGLRQLDNFGIEHGTMRGSQRSWAVALDPRQPVAGSHTHVCEFTHRQGTSRAVSVHPLCSPNPVRWGVFWKPYENHMKWEGPCAESIVWARTQHHWTLRLPAPPLPGST